MAVLLLSAGCLADHANDDDICRDGSGEAKRARLPGFPSGRDHTVLDALHSFLAPLPAVQGGHVQVPPVMAARGGQPGHRMRAANTDISASSTCRSDPTCSSTVFPRLRHRWCCATSLSGEGEFRAEVLRWVPRLLRFAWPPPTGVPGGQPVIPFGAAISVRGDMYRRMARVSAPETRSPGGHLHHPCVFFLPCAQSGRSRLHMRSSPHAGHPDHL